MNNGDIVKVFFWPKTHERLEGVAQLIQHLPEEDDAELGERWSVRFVGADGQIESRIIDRWVSEQDLVITRPNTSPSGGSLSPVE